MKILKNWLYISTDEHLNYVEHFLQLQTDISIDILPEFPTNYEIFKRYDHIVFHVSEDTLRKLENYYRREQLTTISWFLLYNQPDFQTIRWAIDLVGVTSCFYLQQSLSKLFDAMAMVHDKQLYIDSVFLEKIIMIKQDGSTKDDKASTHLNYKRGPVFTKKEYFLLEALLKGQPLKELAQQMYTTKESVSYHYKKLRRKCDVVNNHQLIAKVMANGWIDSSSYSHLICPLNDKEQ